MATESSPTLLRRRLARRLRRMREAANLSLEKAAPKLDKTRSALGRIESGKTTADVHLIRSMMDVYDQYDAELVDMARMAQRQGWWVAYGIRDQGFIGMETDAAISLELSLLSIPGLLQTEDYMRGLFGAGLLRRTKKHLENDVTARLIRQRRLTDDRFPISFTTIMDEAALRKPVGGPNVMRTQLRHLVDLAVLDTVTVQVLPDSIGAHRGMDGAFTILEFEEEEDLSLLYVEYPTGAVHVEKADEVRDAKLVFDNLRSTALPPMESVAFIRRMADEL